MDLCADVGSSVLVESLQMLHVIFDIGMILFTFIYNNAECYGDLQVWTFTFLFANKLRNHSYLLCWPILSKLVDSFSLSQFLPSSRYVFLEKAQEPGCRFFMWLHCVDLWLRCIFMLVRFILFIQWKGKRTGPATVESTCSVLPGLSAQLNLSCIQLCMFEPATCKKDWCVFGCVWVSSCVKIVCHRWHDHIASNHIVSSCIILPHARHHWDLEVAAGEVEIQGGIYDLETGHVEFLGQSPAQNILMKSGATFPAVLRPVQHQASVPQVAPAQVLAAPVQYRAQRFTYVLPATTRVVQAPAAPAYLQPAQAAPIPLVQTTWHGVQGNRFIWADRLARGKFSNFTQC